MEKSELEIEKKEERKQKKTLEIEGTLILPWLVVCGMSVFEKSVKSHKITHHVNAAQEFHKMLKVFDEEGKKIYIKQKDVSINYRVQEPLEQEQIFEDAALFIKKAKDGEGMVLVTCARGRSRSVSVCLYYLMKYEGMSLTEAYNMLKEKRPSIGPSSYLKRQLVEFEKKLTKKQSFIGEEWSKPTSKRQTISKLKSSKK